ncbi:MAG: GerAB/ArcD/ProY family transporter [Clostridia bacterium]|nr:GerAB/ArcD/ProY family transporter [Clostridia bacterium]
MISSRQFYITIFIFSLCLKIQKLPALIAENLGKDGYILILFYTLIEVVGISIAFLILKNEKKTSPEQRNLFFKGVSLAVSLGLMLLFIFQGLLFYEAVQDLFEHILFDNLSWPIFSILFLIAIFFLSNRGVSAIGKNFELYVFLIGVSFVILIALGVSETDFTVVLPIETINFKNVANQFVKFNLWFGDFFLILFLGRRAEKIKFSKTILSYVFSMVIVVGLYIIFFGIYKSESAIQSSLISEISEQSMLGADIGRIDWFLILFTQIGSIICTGLCMCMAVNSFTNAFQKANKNIVLLVILIAVYFLDLYFLNDTHSKMMFFFNFGSQFALITKLAILALMTMFTFVGKSKQIKKMEAK